MIDVTKAIDAAKTAFREYYPQHSQVRLEEVQRDQSTWYITLGFLDEKPRNVVEFLRNPHPEYERVYKVFEVDADKGEVVAMKLRDV